MSEFDPNAIWQLPKDIEILPLPFWKCEYCGRANKPDGDNCKSCGAPADSLFVEFMQRPQYLIRC